MRYILLAIVFFLSGCGVKVFEPKKTETKKLNNKTYHKFLSDYTKNNLTFSSLTLKQVPKKNLFDDGLEVVKTNYDENLTKLGKFIKINKDLAVNGDKLYVISQKKIYKLPFIIFSATKEGNIIAFVLENGKFGLYDLKNRKIKAIYESDTTLSVKYLHSNPLFYKDLVLFPLLTGDVAIVDLKSGEFIRKMNISQNQFNDNVIFLKIVNNQLFMATPSKLVLFNPSFLIDYKADIKHIIDYKGYIYLFTIDGEIVKLDSNLKVIKKVKLPYASFFAPSICKGNIWTVESEGYLLKITPELNVTVYTGNNFDTGGELKIENCKIYNDDKVYVIE